MAVQLGHNCYIAAQLYPAEIAQMQDTFTVGDKKTYGDYYNAPLEKGQKYDLWFGLVREVDGVSIWEVVFVINCIMSLNAVVCVVYSYVWLF